MKRRNFLLLPFAPLIARVWPAKKNLVNFKFVKGPVYKFASKEALDKLQGPDMLLKIYEDYKGDDIVQDGNVVWGWTGSKKTRDMIMSLKK